MVDSGDEWVGHCRLGGRTEFVQFTGLRSRIPLLSLPNQQRFRLAARPEVASAGEVTLSVIVDDRPMTFAGRLDGDSFAGEAVHGNDRGQFVVTRTVAWEHPAYRALSARYETSSGRRLSVFVNTDDWVGDPTLFYSEGDRFVRLHPVVNRALISEAAERFTLAPDAETLNGFRDLSRTGNGAEFEMRRLAAWTEEHIRTEGPAGTLAGTLLTPPGPGPHPAVVLIHGAAGGRRDIYRAFAEPLVQAGMAALVYDKRGHGESAGDPGPSFEEKSYDAEAWVDYLRQRPDVRPHQVGVWGLSNGSWVAPLVAARRPDVAFVVVIGASGTTAIETEIYRRVFDLREQGVPETEIECVQEQWRLIYDLLLCREADPLAATRFDELAAQLRDNDLRRRVTVQEYAMQEPFLGPIPPYESYQELVDDLPNHSVSDEWTCDPVDSYRRITVPVLFLVGDNDSNLPPLQSARRVSKTLNDAGNAQATVIVLPNTGHIMNVVHLGTEHGMTSEEAGYRFHHFRFAGGFLDIVRSWAAQRATA